MHAAWLCVTLQNLNERFVKQELTQDTYLHLVEQAVMYTIDHAGPKDRPQAMLDPIFSGVKKCDNVVTHDRHYWLFIKNNDIVLQYLCSD